MRPILFQLGDLRIPALGMMLLLAFLVATWIAATEMRRRGLGEGLGPALAVGAMIGGVAGARLYWLLEHRNVAAADPGMILGGGLTYYGGLLGAALALAGICRLYGVPIGQAANCYAVAIPPAYMLARLGCFLAGDDYGTATTLPWGMTFPQGSPATVIPVHPTQLYEMALTLPVFLVLWRRRVRTTQAWTLMWGFWILAGGERWLVEFWRTNPDMGLGMTSAQWISLGLILAGSVGLAAQRDSRVTPSPSALSLTPGRT